MRGISAIRSFLAAIILVAALPSIYPGDIGAALPGRAPRIAEEPATTGRSFVYTITNPNGPNTIAAFERNTETGELTFLGTWPTGGLGNGQAIDSQSPLVASADGRLLFAVNPGSNDISIMKIDRDGSLQTVGGPVASRGVVPASLALNGDLLYVANKGDSFISPNLSGFRIVDDDGRLTRIRKKINLSRGDNPTHLLFNRGGNILIAISLGVRRLECYSVNARGKLRRVSSLITPAGGPFAAQFNPIFSDQLLVADARLPGAASFTVSATGALSTSAAVRNSPERSACWIAVHPDGERLWVSNTGTDSVSLYLVSGDGNLTLAASHSTAAFGRTPFEIVLDPDGSFLYQLNVRHGTQGIHVLRVSREAAAGLDDVGEAGLPADSSPIGLVVVSR